MVNLAAQNFLSAVKWKQNATGHSQVHQWTDKASSIEMDLNTKHISLILK